MRVLPGNDTHTEDHLAAHVAGRRMGSLHGGRRSQAGRCGQTLPRHPYRVGPEPGPWFSNGGHLAMSGGYCLYWEEARGATRRPTGHRAAHQEPTQNDPAHKPEKPAEVPGGALREHGAMTPTGSCLCGRLSWPPRLAVRPAGWTLFNDEDTAQTPPRRVQLLREEPGPGPTAS